MSTYSFEQLAPVREYRDSYFAALNGDIAILARIAAQFAVHETSPPTMALMVVAGSAFRDGTVIEVPARTLPPIAAPATNPRIDRVVIDTATDAVVVVRGTEATTPIAPPVPAGHLPLARLALVPGMAAITNATITDERVLPSGGSFGGLIGVRTFTASGTYTPTLGTRSVIVEVIGGGGSGGGCGACNANQGAAASGGSSASFAKARLTNGFSNVAVTVGAAGAQTSASAIIGNGGGSSSFGNEVVAPGGIGGNAGTPFTPPAVVGGALPGASPTGGNLTNTRGSPSQYGSILSVLSVIAGVGGPSVYGGGGTGGGNGPGDVAGSPGAGGGGASSIRDAPARPGGAGGAGIVIIYEYS